MFKWLDGEIVSDETHQMSDFYSAQVLHNNSVMCVSSLTRCGLRAHLSCGAACSCGERAGVRRCDENAPWPGSLTSCPVPALWLDRCLGTCTSVNTLPKCRARTHREATHWPASSLHKSHTSWMLDRRLYHTSAPVPSMSSANSTRFNMWPALCTARYLDIVKEYVFFILLRHGCELLFPPSLIWLLLVFPSPSSLGPFFFRVERRWGGNNDQKTSFRPHAERIVRGRGPRGTVLSNNICAIHSTWDGEGRGTENKAQSRGGGSWKEVEIRGRQHREACFPKSDQFH